MERRTLVEVTFGDPVLMVRSVWDWLRSHLLSVSVCGCVSAGLLLHYCSVCQVRDETERHRLEVLLGRAEMDGRRMSTGEGRLRYSTLYTGWF